MEEKRIDSVLCEKGLASSRQRAKEILNGGYCKVNGTVITKASFPVKDSDEIIVEGGDLPYVSRGGLKLKKAVDQFHVSLLDKVCLDIGASTGGFTDCMLQEGAKAVYSIDTGHDQLVESLRHDPRVCNLEGTNAKDLTKERLYELAPWETASFAAMDVSFVSITKLLPSVLSLLRPSSELVVLIKPQFEAGPALVGKKGVVKDKKIHKKVLQDVYLFIQRMNEEYKLSIADLSWSPIKGGEGNIEFLMYLFMDREGLTPSEILKKLDHVVEDAHDHLK